MSKSACYCPTIHFHNIFLPFALFGLKSFQIWCVMLGKYCWINVLLVLILFRLSIVRTSGPDAWNEGVRKIRVKQTRLTNRSLLFTGRIFRNQLDSPCWWQLCSWYPSDSKWHESRQVRKTKWNTSKKQWMASCVGGKGAEGLGCVCGFWLVPLRESRK